MGLKIPPQKKIKKVKKERKLFVFISVLQNLNVVKTSHVAKLPNQTFGGLQEFPFNSGGFQADRRRFPFLLHS